MALFDNYRIVADWNRNKLFTHAQSVLARIEQVDLAYGFRQPYGEVSDASQMIVTLNNSDGRYFVEEATSPFFGVFRKNVLVQLQKFYSAAWNVIYSGSLAQLVVEPKGNPPKIARLIVTDPMARLEEADYAPEFQQNVTTDGPILRLFDRGTVIHPYPHLYWLLEIAGSSELGTTTTLFEQSALGFDTGKTTLEFVGDNADEGFGISALNFVQNMVSAEGGGRFYYDPRFNNLGRFVFWNRHHTSGIETTADLSNLILDDPAPVYRLSDDICNVVEINFEKREIGTPATVLYSSPTPISVPAAQTRSFKARYRNNDVPTARVGGKDMLVPVAGLDYIANSESDGSGSVQTANISVYVSFAGNSAEVSITNNTGATVYVTTLQLRGTPITTYARETVTDSDPDSIAAYGLFKRVLNMNYVDDVDFVLNYAHGLITRFSQPTGRWEKVSLRDSTLDQGALFTGVVIDRPEVNNTETEYLIVGVEQHLIAASGDNILTLILEPYQRASFWVLEIAGSSELGVSTVLAL